VGRWRVYVLAVLALGIAVGLADWGLAVLRRDDVLIETSLEPEQVVADGQSTVTIHIRVLESGRPREGALLQLWINRGSGFLVPEWVITDSEGRAKATFTPNKATRYDLYDAAVISVMDTSVGRLVEVDKLVEVEVPIIIPEE